MLTKVKARVGDVSNWAIAVFRIVVGFLFFCHGASTLFGWFVMPYGGGTAEVGAWPSWYAGVIQFVGGLLIILGWGTRTAALVGSGAMAVAYFWKHQGEGLLPIQNDGDTPALLAWALVLLVFLGPGRFALESVLRSGAHEEAAVGASAGRPLASVAD